MDNKGEYNYQTPDAGSGKITDIKKEVLALAILIPLAIVLWGVFGQFSQLPNEVPAGERQLEDTPQVSKEETGGIVAGERLESAYLSIEFPDGTKDYHVKVSDETTVAEILQVAKEQYALNISSKDYGGDMGIFIEGFNGITGDERAGLFWQFYINGKLSPTGISSATIRAGDVITWKYEPMQVEE